MADDHASAAIGAYGGLLAELDPTPTLDRLAAEGVLVQNCFCTNSICTPSRASIITGQYSHRNGVKTLQGSIETPQQSLPRAISSLGYQTAMVGKWHLEAEPGAFDFYTVLPGQGSYFNPIFRVRGRNPWPGNTFRVAGGDSTHVSDAVTDISLRWLADRDKSKPFFLMHHFKAPHDNFENAERYDFLYDDVTIPEPASLRVRGRHGPAGQPLHGTSVGGRNARRNMGMHMFVDPSFGQDAYLTAAYQRYLKKYLRTVRGVDDNVARLIQALRNEGQLDNTVIVYTSDQGFMLGEHDYIDKRWMYEPSLRMPLIVRYPPSIPAGSSIDAIVNNVDFAPTLVDAAGGDVADSTERFDWQGRSFWPMLTGSPPLADWPDETYYRYWMHMAHHDNPAHLGIRTDRYKLIYFYGLPLDAAGAMPEATEPYWELYDIAEDPGEMNNLVNDPAMESTMADLRRRLQSLMVRVGDRMPQ